MVTILSVVKLFNDEIVFMLKIDKYGRIRNNIVGRGRKYLAVSLNEPVIDTVRPREEIVRAFSQFMELIKRRTGLDVAIAETPEGDIYIEIYKDHGVVNGLRHIEFRSGIIISPVLKMKHLVRT